MTLPAALAAQAEAAYPDRHLNPEPWLPMWDPTGTLWYITPFDHEDQQVMYSETGHCMTRPEVEDLHGPLHDATAEQARRRQEQRRTPEA